MSPVLFEFFGWPIHSWGVAAATAFAAVTALSVLRANATGIDTNRVTDLLFYAAIAGWLCGRLGYFAEHPSQWGQISDLLNPRLGGASMYGAAAGVLVVFFWMCRRHSLDPKALTDVFAPGLAIGLALHRLGCLAAGCCGGSACDSRWAVSLAGQLVHPTQLYEAVPLAVLAGVMLWRWDRRAYVGQVTWWFGVSYGVIRLLSDGFRANTDRAYLIGESVSVAQGITGLAVIVGWFWVGRKR